MARADTRRAGTISGALSRGRKRREAKQHDEGDTMMATDNQRRSRRDSGRGPPIGQDRAIPVMMADVNFAAIG